MHSTDIQWSAILSWGYADNILRLKSKQSEPPVNFIQSSQLHQVKQNQSLVLQFNIGSLSSGLTWQWGTVALAFFGDKHPITTPFYLFDFLWNVFLMAPLSYLVPCCFPVADKDSF